MMAIIALEHVGHQGRCSGSGLGALANALAGEYEARRRSPWVARITGRCPRYGLAREFVPCRITDPTRSNNTGSRGVRRWYVLDPGYYEVNAWESWRRRDRHFIRVTDGGDVVRVPQDEVDAWLSTAST